MIDSCFHIETGQIQGFSYDNVTPSFQSRVPLGIALWFFFSWAFVLVITSTEAQNKRLWASHQWLPDFGSKPSKRPGNKTRRKAAADTGSIRGVPQRMRSFKQSYTGPSLLKHSGNSSRECEPRGNWGETRHRIPASATPAPLPDASALRSRFASRDGAELRTAAAVAGPCSS